MSEELSERNGSLAPTGSTAMDSSAALLKINYSQPQPPNDRHSILHNNNNTKETQQQNGGEKHSQFLPETTMSINSSCNSSGNEVTDGQGHEGKGRAGEKKDTGKQEPIVLQPIAVPAEGHSASLSTTPTTTTTATSQDEVDKFNSVPLESVPPASVEEMVFSEKTSTNNISPTYLQAKSVVDSLKFTAGLTATSISSNELEDYLKTVLGDRMGSSFASLTRPLPPTNPYVAPPPANPIRQKGMVSPQGLTTAALNSVMNSIVTNVPQQQMGYPHHQELLQQQYQQQLWHQHQLQQSMMHSYAANGASVQQQNNYHQMAQQPQQPQQVPPSHYHQNYSHFTSMEMQPQQVSQGDNVPPTHSPVVSPPQTTSPQLDLVERPQPSNGAILPHTSQPLKGTYIDVTEYLSMPQNEAARRLGIPTSTLSKRWKEASVNRKWPHRIISKLDKEIMTLLHNMPKGETSQLPPSVQHSLSILWKKKQEELRT